MIILGIESSCDETACAIVQKTDNGVKILSNVVASSAKLQEKFGGVIPEQAAREQIKSIIPVIQESLQVAGCSEQEIDAIAVTYGPGLIGSLLVGVETAKILAKVWGKPLIPVNHLLGHFYANWICDATSDTLQAASLKKHESCSMQHAAPSFPCLGLLVSGGHTDLVLFKDHGKFEYLGGTRDDAAGECFDKCARLLNLPYPGGPNLAKLAETGDPKAFPLPRPMINSKDFDFSFSGLKTAVANLAKDHVILRGKSKRLSSAKDIVGNESDSSLVVQNDKMLADLAASIEQSIVDVLVKKTVKAAQTYKIDQIIIAGGVAANQLLISELKVQSKKLKVKLYVPLPKLCTDNAAMIAAAALFNYQSINPLFLQVNPNLNLSS